MKTLASSALKTVPLLCLLWGCRERSADAPGQGLQDAANSGPPRARFDLVEDLRRSRALPRSEADGGGHGWLEPGDDVPAHAGTRGRWTLGYEAGPLGIEVGGFLRLTVPAFWEWSPPQTVDPDLPGFTRATTEAAGVTLEAVDVPGQWVDFKIRGRPLRAGERIRIVYGAGTARARADRYAEDGSRFWLSVDGDGDGIARLLTDSPSLRVLPGPPARIAIFGPSTARPEEPFEIHLSILDPVLNAGPPFTGTVQLLAAPDGLELPLEVRFDGDGATQRISAVARNRGVFRIIARTMIGDREVLGECNPLLVDRGLAPIRWADLHGHSNLSDGTGTPADYLQYAREVSRLDAIALTDHDHWGMLFLDDHPQLWDEIRNQIEAFHDPGHFVTVLGYEWTNWVHGHRHVLYFGKDGPVLSSLDEETDTPTELWQALREKQLNALTFAHHSAGGPIPTNWTDYPPDPAFEPVTEIASVHGSSEAPDAPHRIYNPLPGNFVRDVLDRGIPLGFIGSGDSHDGHPGLAHEISPYMGGLAALLTDDWTRSGLRNALVERRCYATNGPSIILRAALDAHRMGSTLPPPPGEAGLYVRVIACAPIRSIEVVHNGVLTERFDSEDYWDVETSFSLSDLASGDYLYVRVQQVDGGAAWSSPFFIE